MTPRPPDFDRLLPSGQILWKYPTEAAVTKDSPPTFLFHAGDDPAVSPAGSLRVYQALRASGIPAEVHVFRSGGHGFGIKDAKGPVSVADAVRRVAARAGRPGNALDRLGARDLLGLERLLRVEARGPQGGRDRDSGDQQQERDRD